MATNSVSKVIDVCEFFGQDINIFLQIIENYYYSLLFV